MCITERILLEIVQFGSRKGRHAGERPDLAVRVRVRTSHHSPLVLGSRHASDQPMVITSTLAAHLENLDVFYTRLSTPSGIYAAPFFNNELYIRNGQS